MHIPYVQVKFTVAELPEKSRNTEYWPVLRGKRLKVKGEGEAPEVPKNWIKHGRIIDYGASGCRNDSEK